MKRKARIHVQPQYKDIKVLIRLRVDNNPNDALRKLIKAGYTVPKGDTLAQAYFKLALKNYNLALLILKTIKYNPKAANYTTSAKLGSNWKKVKEKIKK